MKFIKRLHDQIRPKFEDGGSWHVMHPLFEAWDTFMFNTDEQTETGPHIRDSVDIKRVMIIVVVALLPATIFGILNTGYQEALAAGLHRTWIANFLSGLQLFVPIVLVSYATGGFWEVLFSIVRKHKVDEGFLVTGLLIPLIMPATIPLWQVVVATSFGVVIGKMIFGGTGMNIFNPALTARAFIFFAYPGNISGDKVWVAAIDGFSGATALSVPAGQISQHAVTLLDSIKQFDFSWFNMFMGWIPGSIGETSTLMILIGALILVGTKVGSWRVMVGGVIGLVLTAVIMNLAAPYSTNSMLTIPSHYHLVMGGFMFGIVFMATDPVSACYTNGGRWIYGILIGFLTVIIRSVNPAYPEGTMLAILLMNAFSPLIDYFVVQRNIKKRVARYAQ
ncbi:MAG: NADH:ubiquinone reductase (Na(+)-transporting) subunit B [Candidatus Marinimicrobia bacterium]|nr:NADH:ubiquinone reductase (Na(+)-transporting) subunit B [Candidatus Neomarinimicrobiota bacterium]